LTYVIIDIKKIVFLLTRYSKLILDTYFLFLHPTFSMVYYW